MIFFTYTPIFIFYWEFDHLFLINIDLLDFQIKLFFAIFHIILVLAIQLYIYSNILRISSMVEVL